MLAGAGTLLYGAMFETGKLRAEKVTLRLPGWPESLRGYRLGFFADLHIRDRETIVLTRAALSWLKDQNPDSLAIAGDFLQYYHPDREEMLRFALEEALFFRGRAFAVPGNHDHFVGSPELFRSIVEESGIKLLQNERCFYDGIEWIGIDSFNANRHDVEKSLAGFQPANAAITLWHEPDMVDLLPKGSDLMLSGHSHGGQFCAPWGWAPMKTRNGAKYVRGFYPLAPTPLYVTRGLATTGPPARLFCPPEVAVLTIIPG